MIEPQLQPITLPLLNNSGGIIKDVDEVKSTVFFLQADALAVAESVEALVKSAEQTDYLDHAHNDTENSSICENRTDVLDRRRAVIKTLEEVLEHSSTNCSVFPQQAVRKTTLPCPGRGRFHWHENQALISTLSNAALSAVSQQGLQ